MLNKHKNKKWIMVGVANDFQIPFHDERALALFKLFLQRKKPDWLVLNGDFQDFWEISSIDLTPRIGKEFIEEIKIEKKSSNLFAVSFGVPASPGSRGIMSSGSENI
jgi:hypothetical protein